MSPPKKVLRETKCTTTRFKESVIDMYTGAEARRTGLLKTPLSLRLHLIKNKLVTERPKKESVCSE